LICLWKSDCEKQKSADAPTSADQVKSKHPQDLFNSIYLSKQRYEKKSFVSTLLVHKKT